MNEEQFLEDSEVQDIAQAHIERIVSFETKEADRIVKVYRKIRGELRDRLDSLPGGTFTEQRLKGVLLQVDGAIHAINRDLQSEMDSSAQGAAERGIDDLTTELQKYNKKFTGAVLPINIDAVAVATDTKNFLFNQYDSSMENYTTLKRSQFARGLTESVIMEDSISDVISKINKTLMTDEWKAQQIVRTELHNIYSVGKLNAMGELWQNGEGDIPDLKKGLFHPMDSRTGADSRYVNRLELVVPLDQPFKYRWDGKVRTFMAPPDRPNDRAILIPFRSSWRDYSV